MQPVMKSIEAKYGKEVKVDFHAMSGLMQANLMV